MCTENLWCGNKMKIPSGWKPQGSRVSEQMPQRLDYQDLSDFTFWGETLVS